MTTTIKVMVTYEVVTYARCGVGVGLVDYFAAERREDHRTFYCPNGHSQYFPAESEAEQLRRQLKAERTTKGVVTKLRKRAIVGACAFCHRHFANVERHVASQHPGEIA